MPRIPKGAYRMKSVQLSEDVSIYHFFDRNGTKITYDLFEELLVMIDGIVDEKWSNTIRKP